MNEQVKEKRLSTADFVGVPKDGEGSQTANQPSQKTTNDAHPMALFVNDEMEKFRSRWMSVQTGFVDDPRHAVEDADALVAEVMQRLAQIFSDERANLEGQWGRGTDVSTEDLRVTLQRYRSFFDRLLSM